MESIHKEIKVLKSIEKDIQRRLDKGDKTDIMNKIQKFIVRISILECSFNKNQNENFETLKVIEQLKVAGDNFQSIVAGFDLGSRTKEDEILENLQILKEISLKILEELEEQNRKTEKSVKNIENNEEIIVKARARLSGLEKFLDCIPNSCLITTIILTFVSTLLILSIL